MKWRRVLLGIVSVALAAVLIILIIRIGNIDLHSTWHEIEGARPSALIGLVLLNVLLIYLSTEKVEKRGCRSQAHLGPCSLKACRLRFHQHRHGTGAVASHPGWHDGCPHRWNTLLRQPAETWNRRHAAGAEF